MQNWIKEAIRLYKENVPYCKIANIVGVNRKTVSVNLRKLGFKSNEKYARKINPEKFRKYDYSIVESVFENIDTEEKAYWLGFLTADGWISKNDKNNAGVTGIELQYGDINHLKKFNKSIGGNYQITDRWKPCKISSHPDKKHHTCVIRIFSSTMYNSLVEKGFTKDKSYDCSIPLLRQDLVRHYMRGYFDGDGCFTLTNKSFHINFITASKMLNNDIVKILKKKEFNFKESTYITEFNTSMYRIDIYRTQDKVKFLDWIYSDCNTYLERKYKKYLKVKNMQYPQYGLAV